MPPLDFGAWLPDMAAIGAPHLRVASGCLPAADHYRPLPSLTVTTGALGAKCRGVFPVRDTDNAAHMFAADADELYKLIGGTWTNYSRTSAYTTLTTTGRWRGGVYGDRLIVSNGLDAPQYIDMSSAATQFADLPGSPGPAKFVASYSEFVFLGGLGSSSMAIKWSGAGDSEGWTAGVNQSDEQEFADGGIVTGFASTKSALYVFQEKCIRRVYYVGGDLIMQIDKLLDNIGCIEPNSLIQWGQICFFLAEDGWYMWDFMSQPQPIGQEKFDRWFIDTSAREYWYSMSAAIDPKNRVFCVAFSTGGGETPDTLLFFHYGLGRATTDTRSVEMLAPAIALGVTLDSLLGNLDTDYTISFDDPFYQGGAFYFAAFDSSHRLASFSGANVEATFTTNEMVFEPGARRSIAYIKPVTDAENATAAAGSKVKPSDAITFQSAVSQQASGRCPQRGANGFYHAMRVVIPAGDDWTFARGMEFESNAVRSMR